MGILTFGSSYPGIIFTDMNKDWSWVVLVTWALKPVISSIVYTYVRTREGEGGGAFSLERVPFGNDIKALFTQ